EGRSGRVRGFPGDGASAPHRHDRPSRAPPALRLLRRPAAPGHGPRAGRAPDTRPAGRGLGRLPPSRQRRLPRRQPPVRAHRGRTSRGQRRGLASDDRRHERAGLRRRHAGQPRIRPRLPLPARRHGRGRLSPRLRQPARRRRPAPGRPLDPPPEGGAGLRRPDPRPAHRHPGPRAPADRHLERPDARRPDRDPGHRRRRAGGGPPPARGGRRPRRRALPLRHRRRTSSPRHGERGPPPRGRARGGRPRPRPHPPRLPRPFLASLGRHRPAARHAPWTARGAARRLWQPCGRDRPVAAQGRGRRLDGGCPRRPRHPGAPHDTRGPPRGGQRRLGAPAPPRPRPQAHRPDRGASPELLLPCGPLRRAGRRRRRQERGSPAPPPGTARGRPADHLHRDPLQGRRARGAAQLHRHPARAPGAAPGRRPLHPPQHLLPAGDPGRRPARLARTQRRPVPHPRPRPARPAAPRPGCPVLQLRRPRRADLGLRPHPPAPDHPRRTAARSRREPRTESLPRRAAGQGFRPLRPRHQQLPPGPRRRLPRGQAGAAHPAHPDLQPRHRARPCPLRPSSPRQPSGLGLCPRPGRHRLVRQQPGRRGPCRPGPHGRAPGRYGRWLPALPDEPL
ncbi:MAG: 2',3'-cyclic-nucleotide 2'-phosphodiesterase / 3'-nucleotidase, partial [uncultured Rubellimicrobium sp.]